MATESRRADSAVAHTLFAEGYRFDFFQAVRLLEQLDAQRQPVGRAGAPEAEAVRFHARLSLDFPPSTIYEIALPVAVGLTGEQYADPAAFDAAYRSATVVCAVQDGAE